MNTPAAASPANDEVDLLDALHALAFVGDLSMGQPVDHSARVAFLAAKLALHLGFDSRVRRDVAQSALLRWSGCTANATEVSQVISDDIAGRAAMLSLQIERVTILIAPELVRERVARISAIHCEVSSLVARLMQLSPAVVESLECVFEHWDGTGAPRGRRDGEIPIPAQIVGVASELEIFSREFGLANALQMLDARGGRVHARELVDVVGANAQGWIAMAAQGASVVDEFDEGERRRVVPLALLADVVDLKLPWLTGHSREVARLADLVAARLGLGLAQRTRVRRAGLLHGLGRVAVPNAVWNRPGPLSPADWEAARLGPYWTSRAARAIHGLQAEAEIASYACERLDGSGYFRASRQANTPLEHRILPVVTAFLGMQARRPWRAALPRSEALTLLADGGRQGQFDPVVVGAVEAASSRRPVRPGRPASSSDVLTAREREVLRCVSLGDSNKDAAARLGISPATIRTHMENVFRKLACNSRSAATLRASMLGLL